MRSILFLKKKTRRGHYISAHVLLLNELEKRYKILGILLPFRYEFNKFNNKGARMLDSIYHMALKLFLSHFLA